MSQGKKEKRGPQLKNPDLQKNISAKIKSLRQEKGVTQMEFLHDTKIHIGRIENTPANISVATLKVICDYLEITLSDFFKDLA